MVVENFSQNVINSGILKLYLATGFFATLIFFVINANFFTPLEMIFGIIMVTIILKGLSNIMLSLIISFFSLNNRREELDFKYNEDKINEMMAELAVQEIQNTENKHE